MAAIPRSTPVLSLAVLINERVASDGKSVDETCGFFVRNQGDEGECSEQEHVWDGLPGGQYAIQLSWPKDATGVSVAGRSTDVFTSSAALGTGPTLESGKPWSYLEFRLPEGEGADDVDGQITLRYALASGSHHRPRRVTLASDASEHDEDVNWPSIERNALADTAKFALFDNALRAVAPELSTFKRTRVPG